MWLVHTKELRIQEFRSANVPEYAVLSHTWGDEEVTFQDMKNQRAAQMKGFSKVQNCCKKAVEDGYSWAWIDTCSIDKASLAELTEAIVSMYSWYRNSAVCYAYLEDVQDVKDLEKSRWFSRGWALQELIAPRHVILIDGLWRKFGTKQSFAEQITSITGIPRDVLLGKPPNLYNIAQRMSWASARQTTREEDKAYCLMGIFDVYMTPIYGEGAEVAFLRLQEEILRLNSDQTLFLWTPSHEPYNQGLLATSPQAFCTHRDCFRWLPGLETVEQNAFDPYSFIKPLAARPLIRNFDKSGFEVNPRDAQAVDQMIFTGSLGPLGLQISLLAEVSVVEAKHRSRGLVQLDVIVLGPDFHKFVFLFLVPDVQMDISSGFILSRLGHMARVVCEKEGSGYILDAVGLSFKRTTINVSQISTSSAQPDHPTSFMFQGQEPETSINEAMILETGGFIKLSCLTEPFTCGGGIVRFQHSCLKCNRKDGILFVFGTRQSFYPWCCLSSGDGRILDPSDENFYRELERSNARFYNHATFHLTECKHVVVANIRPNMGESCFIIELRLRDG